MATPDEAAIMLSRIERYFANTFPDEVRKEYLKDFKGYPADVLSQAIAAIMESTSHVRPPPTRRDIHEATQRIYEARAEKRKADSPTLRHLKDYKSPSKEDRVLAREAITAVEKILSASGEKDTTLKPGNLHPLPEVDRQLRPRVYEERRDG